VVESFFAALKRELVHDARWGAEAHRAVVGYLDGWHNVYRRHSALGHLSPAALLKARLHAAA
jgi:putative transposase